MAGGHPYRTSARALGGNAEFLQVGRGLLLGARAHGGGRAVRRYSAEGFLLRGVRTKSKPRGMIA